MLHSEFSLDNSSTIIVEYSVVKLELFSLLNFVQGDLMTFGLIKDTAGSRIGDDDRDSLSRFSSVEGGTVVFTLKIASPVFEMMNKMKVSQLDSFRSFNIDIKVDEGKIISFKECIFGIQSDTHMSLFSIMFSKFNVPIS